MTKYLSSIIIWHTENEEVEKKYNRMIGTAQKSFTRQQAMLIIDA